MSHGEKFSLDQARQLGESIGIDWENSPFDVEQFHMGMEVELIIKVISGYLFSEVMIRTWFTG